MRKPKLEVIQDNDNEVPAEILAEAILQMAKAVKQMNASRLSRNAIVALIKDRSQLNKGTIEIVLNNLDALEENWLKKKAPKP